MLHAWEKYGIEKAEQEHLEKYRRQDRSPYKTPPQFHLSFKSVVMGKIGFIGAIRGKTDFIYINLLNKLVALAPDLAGQKDKAVAAFAGELHGLHVITEGPTDWMHIKSALRALNASGRYVGFPITLEEYDQDMGEVKLLSMCKSYATFPLPGDLTHVFIFDRDTPSILGEVGNGPTPKRWSPRVFSLPIPVPKHRDSTPAISIEFYYRDEEIKRTDANGRRLFISNEFQKGSQRHKSANLVCTDKSKFKKEICVIDNSVFDDQHHNIALPKKHFAKYVSDRVPNFDNFDFASFSLIFETLEKISQAQ